MANAQATAKKAAAKSFNAPITPLRIGDPVADLEFNNVMNYPSSTLRLSSLRGKLVIIDFWGTTCASCIAALPRIDSLQKKYKDKLQIVTVTNYDTREKVTKTLQRYPGTADIRLPVVLNEPVLQKYFPHELLSHVIWIDPSGKVQAVTGSDYVYANFIEEALSRSQLDWPVKFDVVGYDYEIPMLTLAQNKGTVPDFQYYSSFTGHIKGLDATSRMIIDSAKGTITFNYYNIDLLQLCDGAISGSGMGSIPVENLILEVKDSSRIFMRDIPYGVWSQQNTYCYSVSYPFNLSRQESWKFIREDLSRWLGIIGIRVRKMGNKIVITEL